MIANRPNKKKIADYQYASIEDDTRDIRILTLFPGNWHDDIHGSTCVVPLGSDPVYEALSYVWGDEQNPKTIVLDNRKFTVRRNLESALRHLRRPDKSLSLWADAICINQQNTTERSHQVSMMGEIYRKSARVYIWLGTQDTTPASPSNKLLEGNRNGDPFKIVQHFAKNNHVYELPCFRPSLSGEGHEFIDNAEFQKMKYGISDLMDNPWWSRLWCAQEALLPTDALIVLGYWRLPWEELNAAWKNERDHNGGCCAEAALKLPFHFLDGAIVSLASDRERFTAREKFSLDKVLRWCRYKKCQEQRDKVYGVLGIVDEDEKSNLKPDYSASLEVVYTNAMEAIISNSKAGDLQCLTGSGFNSTKLRIPSWVRDLSRDIETPVVVYEKFRMDIYHLYNACGEPASNLCRVEGSTLLLRGLKIGKVLELGNPLETAEDTHGWDLVWEWARIANIYQDREFSFNKDPKQEAFWRTVVADAFVTPNYDPHRLRNSVDLDQFEQDISLLMHGWIRGELTEPSNVFRQALLNAAHGRAMFVSESGSLGLCYPHTQPGDEIWVLCGGKVPFILRCNESQIQEAWSEYQLIGDCYLHGFMDGEALKDTNNEPCNVVLV